MEQFSIIASRFLLKHIPQKGLLLLFCITWCGCSTTYIVTPSHGGGDYSYDDLASEFDGKKANIILKRGMEIVGSEIRANGDTLYFTDPADSLHYAMTVNKILRISRTNHLVGALKGLGLGVLGAALVVAASTGVNIGDSGLALAVIGTIAFPPSGLIVGAIVGHPYEYYFPVDSTDMKYK